MPKCFNIEQMGPFQRVALALAPSFSKLKALSRIRMVEVRRTHCQEATITWIRGADIPGNEF
eukprot:5772632-Pyramimonas_sp.AAC.1